MKISNASKYILGIFAAAGILAGCSSGSQSTLGSSSGMPNVRSAGHGAAVSLIPKSMLKGIRPAFHGIVAPDSFKDGIYVGAFYGTTVYGWRSSKRGRANKANNPAKCTLTNETSVNDLSGDRVGNLIVPVGTAAGEGDINVYGPDCGTSLGTITDPYGQPADAASANASNGMIVVGNIFDANGADGSISTCTISGGCTANLTNSNMYEVAGVAVDKAGDCWADAINTSFAATLTYFPGCTGAGESTTGFVNASYGGLEIDRAGNLISIDFENDRIYVYSGCNPACTVVGGPFALHGESIFGHLGPDGRTFAAGEFLNGQVDIYHYSPTAGLTYKYSFNNGLTGQDTEGVSYSPTK